MKKANKTSSVAAKASKAEVVDTTSSISSVESIDTPIIPAEPTTATEAPKVKKVLDTDSLSVSLASIFGYRTAEQANRAAEKDGHPRFDDEKDLAEVTLCIHKANAIVRIPVYDRRGGLYQGKFIWVSYMMNTDGTVCKKTVCLHRNGKPTEADLMVASTDPNKASK